MDKEKKGLQTVNRTILVLKSFTHEEPLMTLTRIVEKTNLPKTTTHRIIETLVEAEMLQKSGNNYKLGHALYLLGKVAEESNDIIQVASPIMERLRDETNESVAIYKIEDDTRLCIYRLPSKQAISHHVETGLKQRLDVGASGKAMLAFKDKSQIDKIIEAQESNERKEFLIKELASIKENYISYSFNERGAGVNAISSPIFNINGKISYALSLSGPETRFNEKCMKEWALRVVSDSSLISKLLGSDEYKAHHK